MGESALHDFDAAVQSCKHADGCKRKCNEMKGLTSYFHVEQTFVGTGLRTNFCTACCSRSSEGGDHNRIATLQTSENVPACEALALRMQTLTIQLSMEVTCT